MCKETQVFPKLNLLTNYNQLLLHIEIMMLRVDKLGIPSACRELQNNSILGDVVFQVLFSALTN